MASQPWDSLTIDMQHGPVDYQAALGMLQAMSHKDPTPTVRVPWNEPGIIMKCLDAGAMGIICPMVNTAGQAEQFVKSCAILPLVSVVSGRPAPCSMPVATTRPTPMTAS